MSDERYNGWTNWDTWETMLILENTQTSYKWLMAWNKNFKRKIARGKFDPILAEKVVAKYIIPTARGYGMAKHFNTPYDRFTPDSNINPKKVNKAEVVKAILELDM